MRKTFDSDSDFEFNRLEIDLEKNLYLIDGKKITTTKELIIRIDPYTVKVRLRRDERGYGKRKAVSSGVETANNS